jgi:endogenous inhibitor of DNA gyrase (YacG/DUF329 family)
MYGSDWACPSLSGRWRPNKGRAPHAAGNAPAGRVPFGCLRHHMTGMAERPKPCPICGRPAIDRFRPFCSRRCADVDLHRWLSGVYAVPAVEDDGPTVSNKPGSESD